MNRIYQYFDISKQAVHQYEQRASQRIIHHRELVDQAMVQRKLHPRMGAKVLYDKLQPEDIGRVRYEKLLMENGFRLKRLRNKFKTTDSAWVRYNNLIAGKELDNINQVWVSDLTYYFIGQKVYYITLLMDLYSRKILGYSVSERMFAEQSSMNCIRLALKTRGITHYDNLIHHSDRGSQYRYKPYIETLQNKGIKISMCKNVYDNPHIERVNGTVKNDYLIPLGVESFERLQHLLPIVVKRYNEQRPHSSLNKLTPKDFEQRIEKLSCEKRPKTKIKSELLTIHSN